MKKLPILLFAILFLVSACTSAVRGVPLYPEDAAAVTFPVTGGEQFAAKINTTVPFCGFEIKTGEATAGGTSVSLKIYACNVSYEASVSEEPVAQANFSGIKAGDWLYLQTREIPAGEYLLVVTAENDGITFEKTAGKPDSVSFYYAKTEIANGAFPFRLIYKEEKAGTLTASQLLTKSMPAEPENKPEE